MKLVDFYQHYPDETSCKTEWIRQRNEQGIVCKKCGHTIHYWKKDKEQWECKKCHHRTTLRSGTVMENSKLPFQYWFLAIHLLTSTKKSFSAKEIQRQLGHKRYEPIWAMLHKIRIVLGLRDEEYQLKEQVELDEGFFPTVSITRNKDEELKRGRGSQKQTTVLVSAESIEIKDPNITANYKEKRKVKYIKMKVVDSLKKKDLTRNVEEMIEPGTIIDTDGSNSYNDLKKNYEHIPKVTPPKESSKILPWVHKAISNAKRLLLDIHHRIDDDFLQSYLNEFCYKFNRRYFSNLFDRAIIAAVSYRWDWLGEENG